jgi:hypothetical protein
MLKSILNTSKEVTSKKSSVAKTFDTSSSAKTPKVKITKSKAKVAKVALSKKAIVEPIVRLLSKNKSNPKTELALTKSNLMKRQKSKGKTRKRGGVELGALKVVKSDTKSEVKKIPPTRVD